MSNTQPDPIPWVETKTQHLETIAWNAIGHEVTINGNTGKLLSATNGIGVIEGVRLYFDYSEAGCEYDVVATVTPNVDAPQRLVSLTLPEHCVTRMASDCTCDVDPSRCCDEDFEPDEGPTCEEIQAKERFFGC